MTESIAYYHSPCRDGRFAAWTYEKFMRERNQPHQIRPSTYVDKSENKLDFSNVDGKVIYFLDMCIDSPLLTELMQRECTVYIVDHHKTTIDSKIKECRYVDKYADGQIRFINKPACLIDMNHSGAILAWNLFFRNISPPKLFLYIEDQDLWHNQLPYTKEISTYLDSLDIDSMDYDKISKLIDQFYEEPLDIIHPWVEKGNAILSYQETLINEAINNAVPTTLDGYAALKVNVSSKKLVSYVGMRLAESTQIAWAYHDVKNSNNQLVRYNSLRSLGDVDVAMVAQKYGGGGHKHAAAWIGM